MALLDIIMLVVLGLAAVWGFYKGVVKQIGAIAAIIIAIIACRTLGAPATEFIFPSVAADYSPIQYFGARMFVYALVYFVAYYAVIVITHLLQMVLNIVLLGPVDKIAGALFNMLKFCIVLSFILNAFQFFDPSRDLAEASHIAGGELVSFIMAIAPAMVGAITA